MRPTRFVPVVILVGLVASTACNDTTAPKSPVTHAAPAPQLSTLNGVVHLSENRTNGIILSLETGEDVILDGLGSAGLATVANAEVEVRGVWNADTFTVTDFLVRRVDGSEVMDGVLIALYEQDTGGDLLGYGLSLTRGSFVPLANPSAELIAHVGERVWIAEAQEGQESAFGIIGR